MPVAETAVGTLRQAVTKEALGMGTSPCYCTHGFGLVNQIWFVEMLVLLLQSLKTGHSTINLKQGMNYMFPVPKLG